MHGDKTRAKPFDTGVVLVAARLIDCPLTPEFGFDRHYRKAIRCFRAVPATLADQIIDKDAFGRIGKTATLATPPLFGCAGLVVDDCSNPGYFSKLALNRVELTARTYRRTGGEFDATRIFIGFVRYNDDAAHTFGGQLPGQHWHGQTAVDRLTAGHRNSIVEKQLVGDVDLGGDRRADCQYARVGVGAIAQVGEDMRGFSKRRLADPRYALAAHLGKGRGRPVHELGQIMAADSGKRAASLRDLGRSVVRAA